MANIRQVLEYMEKQLQLVHTSLKYNKKELINTQADAMNMTEIK